MPAMPAARKLEQDAFLSAVRSDLTRICTVYISALAEAGDDPARIDAADKTFRTGLASNRAVYERGRRILEEAAPGA